VVVVSSTPSQGLEEGIARSSWYAKGIAFDAEGRFEESYQAYVKARQQFNRQLKRRPRWARMIRGWILKAEFQLDQSRRLRYRPHYRYRSYRNVNFHHTVAKHNKWLAIRAFTGQSSSKLRDQILDEYTRVLRQRRSDDRARLALAAFYHELGRHEEGRREFAKVRRPGVTYVAKDVAYYHTAAGNVEQALQFLEKAVRYRSSDRNYIMRANDFDRLRGHPRFRKLVGEPLGVGH